MNNEIVQVDLSSIAHPVWAMSASEPDPNHCAQAIVARVHALANGHERVAICCDSGTSFRKALDPTYKANRPERNEPFHHQVALAIEALEADGFPVWTAEGFEADDVIASATTRALALEATTVLIVTGDKDLLQLVGPRVRAKAVQDGSIRDASAVVEKFGVTPDQMRDYLTLVGDTSDNVKGATGIGPKKASALLARFRTLDTIYEDLVALGPGQMGLKPAEAAALKEFQPRLEATRALIALKTDVDIPFDALLAPRVSEAAKAFEAEHATEGETVGAASPDTLDAESSDPPVTASAPSLEPSKPIEAAPSQAPGHTEVLPAATSGPSGLAVREPDVLAPAPSEWERQLDPRSLKDAKALAVDMHQSRMFSGYGTPQAVLSTVMVGRELGLPAMASLRGIHNIEGKHSLSASLMVALVLKSGLAEYFEPVSFSATEATFETLRKGARKPVQLTHTIEMARQAWPKAKADWEKSFLSSGWGRNPTDMLVARATARLARLVYPDLLAGLYTPDELAEIRESNREAA